MALLGPPEKLFVHFQPPAVARGWRDAVRHWARAAGPAARRQERLIPETRSRHELARILGMIGTCREVGWSLSKLGGASTTCLMVIPASAHFQRPEDGE